MKQLVIFFLACLPAAFFSIMTANAASLVETPKVTSVPESLHCHDFYKKYVDADGIPVISSERVRDEALLTAREIIVKMLSKRADVQKALVDKGARIMIVGENEGVCDLPEYEGMCNTPEARKFWNWRARGFGGSPESDYSCSCGEENILGLAGDRYEGENILVHEFAHMYQIAGIPNAVPGFNDRLEALYQKNKDKGLWSNTYAMDNKEEYFAETVQSFYNTNRSSEQTNGVHGPIDTREELKRYDPEMYKLLTEFFDPNQQLPLYTQQVAASKKWYNSPGAGNPFIPGYFADPTIRKFGDTYYLYTTTDGNGGGCGPSQGWTSKDFVNWTIAPMNWPSTAQIWAPDVMKGPDGKYYFYYCQACKVYCAVGETPTGPWKNIFGADETVLIPDRFVKGAITLDGQSFVDDDGSVYLFWGTWGIYKGFGCGAGKLNKDMKSFSDTVLIPNTQAKDFFEGPFVFKRNGIYYLTYSSGYCQDGSYKVQYAMSKTGPLGPYVFADNNPILETNEDGTIHGPGHHSILKEGNDYYIVYHRHNIPHSTRGFHRQICADKLTFGKDGHIEKVQASHKGIGFLQPNSNPSVDMAFDKRVKASSWYNEDFRPRYITDNNNATLWKAADCRNGEWIEIDLQAILPVKRIWTQFEYATSFYQYLIETSTDEKEWTVFADRRANLTAGSPMIDHGDVKTRYIRLTFTGNEKNGLFPAIWNMKFFSDGQDPFQENTTPFNGQATAPVPERKGLLIEVNADQYKEGDRLGRIDNLANPEQGFNATATAIPVKLVQGKKAFAFDGTQTFRSDFGLPATMNGNCPYTIAAWIQSEKPAEFEFLLDLNDAYGELEKIIFGYGTNKERGITMHHGSYEDQGLPTMNTGSQWFHLVATFNGYMERIYLNGKLMAEKNSFLRVVPCQIITLGTKFDGENPFKSNLHSLNVYDTPLDAGQIQALYQQTNP